MEETTIAVAMLIDREEIRALVHQALASQSDPKEIEPVDSVEKAQVVLVHYETPMTSTPLPEQINQAQGRPVIAFCARGDHHLTRRLFIEGAADVLPLDVAYGQMLFAIRRAAHSQPVHKGRAADLSDLHLFRELSELAGSGRDLESFFHRIVDIIATIMDVEIVSLMLLNERYQTMWIAAARGLADEIVRTSSIKVGEGISGRVAGAGRPLLIQDVEMDDQAQIEKSSDRYNTKGLLSVPIRSRHRVIGVINVNNKRSGLPFQDSDLNVLITLSNQAGLAIENARLVADLQSKAASLEQAYHELKRLNASKTDLIVNLSHEIKTPLTAILGYVDLLLSGSIEKAEQREATLVKIANSGRHLARLAERIITYFALQTKSVSWAFEMAPLRSLVFTAVDSLRDLAHRHQVEVTLDGPSLSYDVFCDIAHMQEVFANLIENAILFNQDGGSVHIYGEAVNLDVRAVQVHVTDSGCGVPDGIAARIFDGFVQTDNLMADKPEGLGIGLAMSRTIVEAHGGTLTLQNNSTEGATFTVTLPLR